MTPCNLAILFILLSFTTAAQTNWPLAQTIDSLYQVDQSVQQDFSAMIRRQAPSDSLQRQDSIKNHTFVRHIAIIKAIYAQYGYPTTKLVGQEASHHFFTLIQHADKEPAFQARMLPVLDKLSKKGAISRKDYAYLYDRVQRNTGGKQLYGTQLTYNQQGSFFDSANHIQYPPDLADPQHVDTRRKAIGLEPIEQYYEKVLEMLGRPRVKQEGKR
jgi:hypothetical protein